MLEDALIKLRERDAAVSKENLLSEVLDQEEVERVVSSLTSKLKMDTANVRTTVLQVLKLSGKIDEKSTEKLLLRENESNKKTTQHSGQSLEEEAGAALPDTLDDDVPLEPQNPSSFVGGSRSADRMDDDDIEDLLKDDDDNSKANDEIPVPSKSFPSKSKAERGPQIIEPPHIG